MRIKKMITKGELRPVLKQFLPTSIVRNALGQIRKICMLILGNKGLKCQYTVRGDFEYLYSLDPPEKNSNISCWLKISSSYTHFCC